MLVIEADGSRHRFPAIPEPPSLAGAPPGSWQMTFSVPTWLAPYLGGQIWLQLGLAVVPLPAPVGPQGLDPGMIADPGAGGAGRPDPSAPPPREAGAGAAGPTRRCWSTAACAPRSSAPRARERQAEAEVIAEVTIRVERLERELEQAHQEPERLRKLLAERDQQRRAADQRAHAEQALRLELVQEREHRPPADRAQARIAAGEPAAAEARIRDLEEELERVRRQADEAQQVAAAARPPAPAPAPSPAPPEPRPFDLRQELAVALRRRPATGDGGAAAERPPATAAELRARRRERELVAAHRASGSPPAASADELDLASSLAELRAELDQLAEIAERESAARAAAQSRVVELERRVAELERALRERELSSARVYDAVHELRGLLGQARQGGPAEPPPSADPEPPPSADPEPPPSADPEPPPSADPEPASELDPEPASELDPEPASELDPDAASELEPERFDAALSRLRASARQEPELPKKTMRKDRAKKGGRTANRRQRRIRGSILCSSAHGAKF